jgi:orotidine 5'-phosphate decarboxylase subfamily 1
MTSPIWVAIDTPNIDRAKAIAEKVGRHVGGIKLGLEFFCANGRAGILEMAKLHLPIFLDLKLHDIPNTVAKAVQALAPLDPAILTVHAAGGRAMMEDAKAAAPTGCKVVAVTVLTSLDANDLARIQRRLLDAAAQRVGPGGSLTYAVCTWTDAETDQVARWFDDAHGSAFSPGERRQLLPDHDDTDGMYIATWTRS